MAFLLPGASSMLGACGALVCVGSIVKCVRGYCDRWDEHCETCAQARFKYGFDHNPPFSLVIVVHHVDLEKSMRGKKVYVRCVAGPESAKTATTTNHRMGDSLTLRIRQAVQTLRVEVVEETAIGLRHKVLASSKLSVQADLYDRFCGYDEENPPPKQNHGLSYKEPPVKVHELLEQKVELHGEKGWSQCGTATLTFMWSSGGRESDRLLNELKLRTMGNTALPATMKAELMRARTQAGLQPGKPLTVHQKLDIIARTCRGKLKYTSGAMAKSHQCFIAVVQKDTDWIIGHWADEEAFEGGVPPLPSPAPILMRNVKGVMAGTGPNSKDVFSVAVLDPSSKVLDNKVYRRIDRARDIWVACLDLFAAELRAEKKRRKEKKEEKAAMEKANPESAIPSDSDAGGKAKKKKKDRPASESRTLATSSTTLGQRGQSHDQPAKPPTAPPAAPPREPSPEAPGAPRNPRHLPTLAEAAPPPRRRPRRQRGQQSEVSQAEDNELEL